MISSGRNTDNKMTKLLYNNLVMVHKPAQGQLSIGNFLCRVTTIRPNTLCRLGYSL